MAVSHRDARAGGTDDEIGHFELTVIHTEEFSGLLRQFLLLGVDERYDVVDHVERRHTRITGPGDRLERRQHDRIESKRILERLQRQHEVDRRTIPVGYDVSGPTTVVFLAL